jgi:YfiH family protein
MNIIFNYSNNNNATELKYGTNGVPYISYKKLEETGLVVQGFSTKLGGVSKDHLAELNLGYSRGDDPLNVTKNHEIIGEAIGFDYKDIVTTNQTHTTNVRVVTEADRGKGITCDRDYSDIDGLVTNVKGLVLATYFADCVPLYFLDTKNKAIGLTHSGWRGTVGKIGKVTVELMTKEYGTNPLDVIACVGPSICRNCYEVSEDVADEFKKAFAGHEDEILIDKGNGKFLLDLWEANRLVFLEAGIKEDNIAITDICTCCNKDYLFSHRGHNGMRGNLAAFMMLK